MAASGSLSESLGTTTFQFWSDGVWQNYESSQQRQLRESFLSRDTTRESIDLSATYTVHKLHQIEKGEAYQTNKATGYKRFVRLQPAYRLAREGTSNAGASTFASTVAGLSRQLLASASSSNANAIAPISFFEAVDESDALANLPEDMRSADMQYQRLANPGGWAKFDSHTTKEIMLALACRPIPAKILVSHNGSRHQISGLDVLQTGGQAHMQKEGSSTPGALVQAVQKPSFWRYYRQILGDAVCAQLRDQIGKGRGPTLDSNPFEPVVDQLSGVVTNDLVKAVKECTSYPRKEELKLRFEIEAARCCVLRGSKKNPIEDELNDASSVANGANGLVGSSCGEKGPREEKHVLSLNISNVARLEEGAASVQVSQWTEVPLEQETAKKARTENAPQTASLFAGLGGSGGATALSSASSAPAAMPFGSSSNFPPPGGSSTSSLFASNSSHHNRAAAFNFDPSGGKADDIFGTSTVEKRPREFNRIRHASYNFQLILKQSSLDINAAPYEDGDLTLPQDLETAKRISVESISTAQQGFTQPPCSVCLDDDPVGCVKLACGHEFHRDCLEDWLKQKVNFSKLFALVTHVNS